MPTTISVADKPTLDEVNTKVGSSLNKENSIISAIGTSGDAISENTVFGRENKIISDVADVYTRAGTINTNIGTSGDTADNGTNNKTTVFAKLKYLVTTMKTLSDRWTAARATTLDSIGASTDTSSNATVFGKLASILSYSSSSNDLLNSGGAKGTVKQVQFGTWTFTSTSDKIINVTGTIVPAKTIILVQNGFTAAYEAQVFVSRVTEIGTGAFKLSANYSHSGQIYTYGTVTWQLIEFY